MFASRKLFVGKAPYAINYLLVAGGGNGAAWSGGSAPTLTSTASKYDLLSFFSDDTNWFGMSQLNFS